MLIMDLSVRKQDYKHREMHFTLSKFEASCSKYESKFKVKPWTRRKLLSHTRQRNDNKNI